MSKGMQSVFTVKEKIVLTPHYIRVKFGMTAEQADLFRNVRAGSHNKIFIADDIRRTYTTRHIDHERQELWIDFVAHGDNGPASAWAGRACPGDTLGIAMKERSKPLFPGAESYLFAGDHTALPVIGAMLAQLPAGVHATVILEVPGKEDELPLSSEAGLRLQWLRNTHPEQGSRLAEAVREHMLTAGKPFVFVAAEYETARALKSYFKETLAWPREGYSVVSYWTKGESEDQSAPARREERSR